MSNTLRDAIQRIRAGDRIQGRRLLIEVLKVDPENVTALLWMSILVSRKHRQQVLERVLEIDPQNEAARQALNELQETSKTGQKIPPGPQVSFNSNC